MLKLNLFLLLLSNLITNIQLTEQIDDFKLKIIQSQLNGQLSMKFYENASNNFGLKVNNAKNDDEVCERDIATITNDIKKGEIWALKVIDSWGKLPSGILLGRTTDVGNFEECTEISQLIDHETEYYIEGKYCFAELPLNKILFDTSAINILHPQPILMQNAEGMAIQNLKIGICIPKSCRPEVINKNLIEILKEYEIILDEKTQIIQPLTCKTKLNPMYNTIDIVAIVLFSSIGCLMLLSSIYDYAVSHIGKQPVKILTAFSIFSNGKKLFAIQNNTERNPNVIECLNGIRGLSIIWVVFGHQYNFYPLVSTINPVAILEWAKSPFSLLIMTGVLAVDSFFLLSGCLLTWIAFKTMEKTNGRLNIFKMYLHRYLRLTPLLAAFVLYSASLQKYLGNGPFWSNDIFMEYCQQNWWSTLLYVSNYVHPEKLCFGHSWYLNVDFQLFVLSPLILIPLWKWGKIVFIPIIILIQASIGYVFAEFMYREYHYLILDVNDNDITRQKLTYYATHARVSAYLIGIVLGYYLYQYRNKKLNFSKLFITLGWLIALLVIAATIFGLYPRSSQQPNSGMTTIESAIYEPFSRLVWSMALSWIIFACHNGYGGIINNILTFGIWQPFARLTYSIYLSHIIVQFIWYGNLQTEQHFSDMEVIFHFWACFSVTICISVILNLAFESPIIVIESFIFGGRPNQETKPVVPQHSLPFTNSNIHKSISKDQQKTDFIESTDL